MSVVQKKWASVYEDCEYLGLRRFLRKFKHKFMHCGIEVIERIKIDCLMRCWQLKSRYDNNNISFVWGQAKG